MKLDQHLLQIDTPNTIFNVDIIGLISGFLRCKDAIKICQLNRQFHSIFLIPVIRNSFVSINTDRIMCRANSIIPFINTINLHIDGIRRIREPIFLYIERAIISTILLPPASIPWSNLRYISFGRSFNLPINNLPQNIEEIRFHPKSLFTQKITKLNCRHLRKIYFGKSFNQRIDHLPSSVELIHFCNTSKFNMPIKKYPHELQEMYIGPRFNYSLDRLIKEIGIKKIQFTPRSIYSHTFIVPPDAVAAATLTSIGFGMYYNSELNIHSSSIKILKFHKLSRFNQELELPSTLMHLSIGERFNKKIILPPRLMSIKFYAKSKFNWPLVLPNTCIDIVVGRHFNAEIQGGNYFKK